MKIYRCFLGCLLVFFIAIGVIFIVSYINEHRSVEDGVLIWEYNIGGAQDMRGAGGDVKGYRVC